jgi:hypothetical protein
VFRKSFVFALPLALFVALSVASPAGSAPFAPAAIHAPSAMFFSDAAGDSGAAPDITDVDVGNDVVAGPIVFWITLPNRPDDLVAGDSLAVLLNTDRNPDTGGGGIDYGIGVDGESVGLGRWDGTTLAPVEAPSLVARFSKVDKAIRVAIHPNDLGGTTAFDFFVGAFSGDDLDSAPNGPPGWSYTLISGRPVLSIAGSAVLPKRPLAGKPLAVAMQVVRGDINEVLAQGKVTCSLKVGTKSVRATRSGFTSGVAFCSWKVPTSAKGKLLRGTISLTYGGVTAKKSFSVRAR